MGQKNFFQSKLAELLNDEKQVVISQKLSISQSQVSSWLNGRSLPNYVSLEMLSDYFGVSVDYFFENKKTASANAAKKCG